MDTNPTIKRTVGEILQKKPIREDVKPDIKLWLPMSLSENAPSKAKTVEDNYSRGFRIRSTHSF
ncbi:MAG: hypothetical protein R6U96_16980 [Promethearchaeia archaeon]